MSDLFTTADIHGHLKKLLQEELFGCVYLKEFRAGTGYTEGSQRYLDAFAMATMPSSGLRRIGIEIKRSKSDFRRELNQPWKRESALRFCNEFYFAAPAGILNHDQIPVECGLIEISDTAKIVIEAPYRETNPASWVFVASLARRVEKQ